MLAGVLLASASSVFSQQSVDYASISGRVTDPSGAVIEGARVAARNTQTGVTATTATGRDGRFRFPYLRVGSYELVVGQPGFRDATHLLSLTVGAAFELPVSLSVGAVDTSVTVTGETTVLEAARSQIAGTVPQAEVQSVPLNGRNFLELALLVPGVSPTNVASTQLFPETSAVPGITLSINSQRNLSNNFIVDGLSANDDAAGLSGITYGVDALEQVQVVTSGGQAELGRALGGHINIVTRSGTNTLHGTVYDYLRDDRFNARNPLSGTTLPMDQSQYGGSLGGPVVQDRTFYFANVEQRRLDQTGLTTITPANASIVNARLTATGYQAPLVTSGAYPNPVDSTNVLAKLDHNVRDGHMFGIRYSLYDVDSENSRGAGGLNAPSASSALDNLDQTVALSHMLALSPRTYLETRAQVAYSDLKAPPTDPLGPAVTIAGVAAFGRLSTSPTGRENTMYQVVTNLSHQAGAHALKVGADFLYNDDLITFPRAVRGTYGFSSMPAFLSGVYNNAGFTQTFGDTEVSQTNPNLGVYAQDEWKVSPRLTLNAGVRYELQFLETIAADADNISPRLGVTWSPFDARSDPRSRRRGPLLRPRAAACGRQRAAVGRKHDRPDAAAPDQREPVARAGRSPGIPEHPERLRAVGHAAQPDDDGPEPGERLFTPGQCGSRAAAGRAKHAERGVSVRRRAEPVDVREPERPARARPREPTTAAARIRPTPTTANTRRSASPAITACTSPSFSARHDGATIESGTRCRRRQNNVGEFFFSSPIDPLRPLEGLGAFRRRPAAPPRDARRRSLVDGAGDGPVGTDQPRLRVERHGAGVLRAAVQRHLRRDHPSRHCRQAHRQRRLHRTERGHRQRLLQPERPREPHVPSDGPPGAAGAG